MTLGRSLSLAAGSSLLLAGCGVPQQENAAPMAQRAMPNLLIIYADDLGYGDLAIQNPQAKLTTPNLDQLAREGIRFTDAHASSAVCTPSRYALLTGNYHWRRNHGIVGSFDPSYFNPGEYTLPLMLQQAGYHTAAFGKWHLGWDWDAIKQPGAEEIGEGRDRYYPADAFDWRQRIPGGPVDLGFDYYFGDDVINFPPYTWFENDRVIGVPTQQMDFDKTPPKEGRWEARKGPSVADWDPYTVLPTLAEKGVEYLKQQDGEQPFFMYFSLPSPHAPIIPNDEFDGKTQAGAYGDFVYQTDHVIGQLLDTLEAQGLADNTIVIFSSDNGAEKYMVQRWHKTGHDSSGGLRGMKRDLWEGGHRVPMIIRWPAQLNAEQVRDQTISHVDIMATMAGLIGTKLPEDAALDSYDLLPLLTGELGDAQLRKGTVQNTWPGVYAIRQGDWLLIDHHTGSHNPQVPKVYWQLSGTEADDESTAGHLYNLREDLAQKDNQYQQHPERVEQMKALLQSYIDEGRSVTR
ncbi:arylsulfatase [Ferrimonas pelagia]|uniref:Arylsulfatase n=1 Tax=Ferrimonas pelagia TaxID=1177826 RepID=A0ABP9EKC7_9GAMM